MRLYLLFALTLCAFICFGQEKPVTRQEASNYSQWLESVVASKNYDAISKLFDPEVFAGRVAANMKMEVSPDFTRGVSDGLQENFGKKLINSINSSNGFYEPVKIYEKDKVTHVIFRLYGDEGLNYHDFELTKRGDKIGIADIFLYTTGENMSKTVADMAGLYSNFEKENAEIKLSDLEQMVQVKQLLTAERYRDAKDLFDKLPAALRSQKGSQIFYLSICAGIGDHLYTEALNDFEIRYRDEPNLSLALFDLYFMRKQYERALLGIDRVDSLIDKDPFLDFYRGILYSYMDKQEEARKAFTNVYNFKPGFGLGLRLLIVCNLDLHDIEKAKPLIAAYRSNKKFDQSLLDEDLGAYPAVEGK